jgi:hypothetical protein
MDEIVMFESERYDFGSVELCDFSSMSQGTERFRGELVEKFKI